MKVERDLLILGGMGLALLVFYIYKKGAASIGASIGSGAVNAVGGAVTGAWQATTNAVGIPNADADKCAAARASGNTWDAFVYCKPGEFFPYLFGGGNGQCTDCANNSAVTSPYDYGTGTAGVPYAPSATDPGYQMTDYANLGNLKF